MPFRYSVLCGMVSDAVDAVRSTIPKGFEFWDLKSIEFPENIVLLTVPKIQYAQLEL